MPSDGVAPLVPVLRVADVHLRGAAGPIPTRIYWPVPDGDERPPLFVLFQADDNGDRDRLCRRLCAENGAVVLSGTVGRGSEAHGAPDDAVRMTEWAAAHSAELGADADRLIVGGEGDGCTIALAIAAGAHQRGWPPVARLVLLHPPEDTSADAARLRPRRSR